MESHIIITSIMMTLGTLLFMALMTLANKRSTNVIREIGIDLNNIEYWALLSMLFLSTLISFIMAFLSFNDLLKFIGT